MPNFGHAPVPGIGLSSTDLTGQYFNSMAKKTYKILVFILIVAALVFGYEVYYGAGNDDVNGGFERVAYIRNENNMGGTLSYYAYTVADHKNADFEALANRLPHNKHYAVTTVFFFDKGHPAPSTLSVAPPHFDTVRYHPIATYIIHPSGNGELVHGLPKPHQ